MFTGQCVYECVSEQLNTMLYLNISWFRSSELSSIFYPEQFHFNFPSRGYYMAFKQNWKYQKILKNYLKTHLCGKWISYLETDFNQTKLGLAHLAVFSFCAFSVCVFSVCYFLWILVHLYMELYYNFIITFILFFFIFCLLLFMLLNTYTRNFIAFSSSV